MQPVTVRTSSIFLPRALLFKKREENVLSREDLSTLRSIIGTLLNYDASGTEQQ